MSNIVVDTDTYFSMILGLTKLSPVTVFSGALLIFARMVPLLVLVPFLGAKTVPRVARLLFAGCLTIIFLPNIVVHLRQDIVMSMFFIGLMLKEVVIGFILGFLASIPFFIAQSSGSLIDHIRGSSSLQVTDPTTQTQTGPVGILYNYVLIAVFFTIGGPFVFFDALSTSFTIIPVDHLINPSFFNIKLPFWQMSVGLINQVLTIAIQLGAPSIIGILMAEMFLGIANRLAPQVQIVFLGISLKSWVGLGLLAAAWYFIMNQLGKDSLEWMKMIERTMQQLSPPGG